MIDRDRITAYVSEINSAKEIDCFEKFMREIEALIMQ